MNKLASVVYQMKPTSRKPPLLDTYEGKNAKTAMNDEWVQISHLCPGYSMSLFLGAVFLNQRSKTKLYVCNGKPWEQQEELCDLVMNLYHQFPCLQQKETHKLCVEGVLCGPDIKGNPLGLQKHQFFVWDIVDAETNTHLPLDRVAEFCSTHHLDLVPQEFSRVNLLGLPLRSSQDWVTYVHQLKYGNGQPVKGIVVKTIKNGTRVAFRVEA